MTHKQWSRIYLLMLSIVVGLMIGGCLGLYQPKAYLEVTKPPMRVIYLDYHNDISSSDVNQIMKNMDNVKYRPYKFNESNGINVFYDAGIKTTHNKSIEVKK